MVDPFKKLAFLFFSFLIFHQAFAEKSKLQLSFDIPDRVCQRDSVEFINTSTVDSSEFISFQWYFKDLGVVNTLHAKVAWPDTGIKKVILIAYDTLGDSSTLEKSIYVLEAIKPILEVEDICCYARANITNKTITETDSVEYTYRKSWPDSIFYFSCDDFDPIETVTLIAEHPNGCIDSSKVDFKIYSAPDASFSYDVIRSYSQLEAQFYGPDNMQIYMWRFYGFGGSYSESDVQSPIHTFPLDTRDPDVCLTIRDNYCWAEECITIPYKAVSSIDFIEQSIDLFPNPGNGSFILRGLNSQILRIEVYNNQGARIDVVYEQTQTTETTVALLDAQAGVYYVKVLTDTELFIKKIVVTP